MDFLYFLEQFRSPAGNIFFQGITYLGQEFLVIAVICWFYWCSDKKLAYTLGFSYFFSGLLIQGLKITFRIPRPWILDPRFQAVPSALPDATGYSFPSGHTQSITALLGTFAFCCRKKYIPTLCFAGIILVGFSRMYLGCHTPKDVLVSFLLSLGAVLICCQLLYYKQKDQGKEACLSAVMLILCLLLTAYALYLNWSRIIETEYAMDCLKASGAGVGFAVGYYIERTRIRFPHPDRLSAKILCLLVGLITTVVLKGVIKLLLGNGLFPAFFSYLIVVCWILFLYPMVFTRFLGTKGRPARK